MKQFVILVLIFLSLIQTTPAFAGEFQRVELSVDHNTETTRTSNVVYGPVSDNDTLWRIARIYRNSPEFATAKPESLYPVMYGIYVLNPNAFNNQNVNQLLNNAMLVMPAASFVATIDLETARRKMEGDEVLLADSSLLSTQSKAGVVEQKMLSSSEQHTLEQLTLQYSTSLDSIQTLLDENALLSSQLQSVSQQLTQLSQRVDGDVQEQLDAQAELQVQLYQLLDKSSQISEATTQTNSVTDLLVLLKEPLIIISLFSGIILCALVVFGLWLFSRRPRIIDGDDIASRPAEDMLNVIELSDTDFSHAPFSDRDSYVKHSFENPDLVEDVIPEPVVVSEPASDASTKQEPKATSESVSEFASSLIDDIPDINIWASDQHAPDERLITDLENTDFDELLQSLETPAKDEEVKLEPKAPVAPSSLNDKVKNETDEFIDVDTLLADISEMEDEPEIDLLKNIDSMPEPVSENEITDDDVFSSDLDLARVYIEMDDISEALDILKKVLLNGSTSQQAEAKQILTQLDNR